MRRQPRPFKVVYLGRKRPAEDGKRIILKVQEEKKTEPPIGGSLSRQPER